MGNFILMLITWCPSLNGNFILVFELWCIAYEWRFKMITLNSKIITIWVKCICVKMYSFWTGDLFNDNSVSYWQFCLYLNISLLYVVVQFYCYQHCHECGVEHRLSSSFGIKTPENTIFQFVVFELHMFKLDLQSSHNWNCVESPILS